ncbi:Replication initiator protein A [Oceanospirillum sp. D5]|uniref:Replication initiator protein A n=2 Tax=Oceanospirillum sediminis TaxID=2760088 RepID=A0A839IYC2_9GAMM|nr:Replication initiator protein A [Oceanospirillum sediminis]
MNKSAEQADNAPETVTSDQAEQSAEVIRLPVWPESVRGMPNTVLRSALFGAIRRGPRKYQDRVEKACLNGIRLIHSGPTLDQADLDVWQQCLHLAKDNALGSYIEFSAHSFLKGIQRSTGKSQHEWLKGSFMRLAGSVVEISDGTSTYFGPLIHHGKRNEDTGLYGIEINPAMAILFNDTSWTQLEFDQRMALKRQPLAQWLHGFYSTHAQPYPIKVSTLHELCGSETQQMYHFRSELKKALGVLHELSDWEWQIDDKDLVHIKKTPSASQQRHLTKKGESTS